jgi:CubicO group peptidase (beta-lactamase class C family)
MFDLASLTKVIATASIAMRRAADGTLPLETRVADRLASWRGTDRANVTVRHLLDHSSGLPAHARLFEQAEGHLAFERAIAALPLATPPGAAAVYSDLGFMLLGFLLELAGGAPLDVQWRELELPLPLPLQYCPPAALARDIAPTERDPRRGRLLQGEVHDENAAALGGVAGHAGLFGSVGAPAQMREFADRSRVPGSSRALAWDTMKPTSSCGSRLSPTAIGHTGFTGTSLWIDEAKDLYVAFLTNRVHPTRENEALIALRPKLHDAVVEDLQDRRETR